ncbi:MAG: ROK family protein [Nannocystaceae bacterium]|nr:ROK family protein [bacterium]
MTELRFGVDLGGTKIELIALEGSAQRWRKRVPTPQADYTAILETIAALDREAAQALGQRGSFGIGTPGSRSPRDGRMRNCNTVVLNGKPLLRDLEAAVGREVRMANDANCFALSEAVDGAGAGADVVFGVILGTGVGGGVVVHGRVLRGANEVAGEWGHSPMPRARDDASPGRRCYCGRTGCIELFLSGPGMAREHAALHGGSLRAEEIFADPAHEESTARYEARLARALGPVVNLLDPDVIVLGGGISKVERLYENVPSLLAEHVFSDVVYTRIVSPKHGDSSGVRGAAWLWGDALPATTSHAEESQ